MSKAGSSVRTRVPYEPIHKRKKLHLPNGGKIILWVIVNIENWRPERPMPRVVLPPPMGQPMLPDVPNWAWHEYGMRVGFWRYLDALRSRDLKASLAVNGSACTVYPEACEAARDAGWEFMGHGYVQAPMHTVEDEGEAIRKTIEAIQAFTGEAPRGWESPGLTETDETVDLLAEAGIEYVANWVLDDQPVPVHTRTGTMTALPYPVEINDVVISAVQLQPSDEIWRRGKDQFDRLYQESADSVRVMSISIHPFLTGVPHRIKYLEQLLDYILGHEGVVPMTGAEMLEWYRSQAQQN
ncbi:polysaccharide deacetylase family protein [Castellaniella sp. S9]|uniref:polysaccharide deacetylase family protein n=1 Tax=Castellaniella sp. S9 TaxID=2993652 RepID=UPI0022B2DF12|nr:polysaccharide deacetylase family protein [Castellaniella sp. S9]